MSTKQESTKQDSTKRESAKHESDEEEMDEEDEEIDLCEDHDYQVLSAVFETDKGRNVAEILSKIQKDVHLLATSVSQLIQLSLAAHRSEKDESDDDEK